MRFNEKLQVLVHNKWSRFGFVSVAGLTLVGATAVGVHASFAPTSQPVHHIAKTQSSQVKIKASSHIKQSSSTSATSVSSSQVASVSAPEPTSDASQATTTSVAEPQPQPQPQPQATPETTPVAEPAPETTPVAEPAPETTPAPVADTSGFNMLGQHFPIGSFVGIGNVPADGMVYRWASDSRWFLIEQGGQAGQIVQGVGMGAPITVDGHTYHVTDIQHGLENNGVAGAYYASHIDQHAIGFQTCDSYGILSLWFAD